MMLYLDMEDSDKKQPIEDGQLLTQGEILCIRLLEDGCGKLKPGSTVKNEKRE